MPIFVLKKLVANALSSRFSPTNHIETDVMMRLIARFTKRFKLRGYIYIIIARNIITKNVTDNNGQITSLKYCDKEYFIYICAYINL